MADAKPEAVTQTPALVDAASGEAKEYLIGGAVIRLRDDAEALWEEIKQKFKEGLQLNPLYKLQWIRTAVHFAFLGTEFKKLEERVGKLEQEVKRMKNERKR